MSVLAAVAAGARTVPTVAAMMRCSPGHAGRLVRSALACGEVETDLPPGGRGQGVTGAGHVLRLPGDPSIIWEALLLAPLLDDEERGLLLVNGLADDRRRLTTLGRHTVDLAEHLMGLAPEESRPHIGSAVARAVVGHRPGREQRMAIMEGPSVERREELRRLTRPVYREVMTSPGGLGVAAIIAPVYEDHEALARAVLDGLVHRLIAAGEL